MATPPALRVVEHHLVVYRRIWRGTVVSSLLAPVLYLAAMGVGLGSLVDEGPRVGNLGGLSYLAFVGPGLLAAAAMQTGAGECMWPVMGGIKWLRTWHATVATPVSVHDLVVGHFVYTALRVAMGAVSYLVVLALFGVPESPAALLAVPAAILCGMAFATPIAAFAATQENDQGFVLLFRLAIMPLFLFSGTFFPVSQLPAFLERIATVTPLWHGVELCRGLVLGGLSLGDAALHVAYLSAWTLTGYLAARVTFTRRMTP